MVSVTREKRGGTVRINISAREFSELIPEEATRALVMHWIKIGRERENIRDHIDEVLATRFAIQKSENEGLYREVAELKKTLASFVTFFAQVAHNLVVSNTANSQFDLESIHFDKNNSGKLSHEKEQIYSLTQIKNTIFKQLLSSLLPEVDQRFHLTHFLREEEKKNAQSE